MKTWTTLIIIGYKFKLLILIGDVKRWVMCPLKWNITFYLYSVQSVLLQCESGPTVCVQCLFHYRGAAEALFDKRSVKHQQLQWSITATNSSYGRVNEQLSTPISLSANGAYFLTKSAACLLVKAWALLLSGVSPPVAAPTSCRAEADQQQVLRGPQLLGQRADQLPDGGGHGGADGCVGVVTAVDFEQNWKHEAGQASEIRAGMWWRHCDLSQSSPNMWRRTARSLSSLLLIGWRFCSFSSPVLNCRRKTLCCGKSYTPSVL